jgi:single-stranded-DNA-specific exonuclease
MNSWYTQLYMKDTFDIEKLHPLTRLLLEKRGLKEVGEVEDFLFPSYEKHIGDPFLMYGMEKAVVRIISAMKTGEKIAVYSDYDCDGIPGGVLLRTFFDDIGYPVEIYVPHRHNEGYGVHTHAIDTLKKKGVSLVITVDLAITNIDEVAYAKSVGVDFIVTDHHLPITQTSQTDADLADKKAKGKKLKAKSSISQVVPDAIAVINSKQDVCTYHDDMLCGCAVAWKLSCAILSLLREDATAYTGIDSTISSSLGIPESYYQVLTRVNTLKDGYEKWLLDLVGISTISDMVPLQKENRALAHFGLKVLRLTKRHGLNQIFRAQGVSKEHLTEEDIAFTIAPRINAAGRMGDPIQAHHMLYEKDSVKAQGYVEDLEALNMERKESVKDITGNISFDHAVYSNDVIAVGDLSWGPGILGLIAQRIIDETGKPTFVWGQGDDKTTVKGSCRSKGDVHVVELMARVQEMFPGVITHSGGHEQAGGFSCSLDKVEELSDALNEAYKHVTITELGNQELIADAPLTLSDVTLLTHNAVDILSPFGVGNPKPLFSFTNVTPLSVRWFGKKGEHLEVMYPNNKGQVKAIMFFATKELAEKATKPHTLLAHLEKSVFRGKTELRLRIREILY